MIQFYADSFRTLGGWFWRARSWAHQNPRWARTVAVAVLVVYLTVIQARAAHAAGFLPDGVDYTDSHGNTFSSYTTIDIDAGDVMNPGKVIVNFAVQLLWSIQYFATGVVIWLFDFLLSFQWVAWLATPFNTLAVWLQEQLGTINWIPFALMISALVGGIAIYVGRVSGGLWEMLVAAVIAVLALGALANPVATLTATNGMLSNAQTFGGQLATSIVVDESQAGQATMSAAVTSELMDIFVRVPYQVISYAMVLPDDCQGIFDTFIQSGEPQASLRDCAPEAAVFAHDNPGGMNILNAMVNGGGVTVLFLFGMVIAALLMVSVFFFLVAAIKSMLLVYLCILPVNREPLWRSVSDSFMGLVSLVVMTVCLSLYLKLTTWIMGQTGFLPHQLRMVILILVLIIVIVLVWRARKATLRAGRGVAGHLSNLGLGMKGGQKDANALLKMGAVTSMAKTGYDLLKRNKTTPAAEPSSAPAAAVPEEAAPEAPINLQQVPDPPRAASSRLALTAGRGSGPSGSSGGPAPRPSAGNAARKALNVGSAAVTVARGAATGGAGGALVAAGTVVVKGATSKVANAAAAKATTPATDIGELKVIKVPESRIEVGANGVATARRKQAPVVHDISSLPPRAQTGMSQRAAERRQQLEAYRPKQLAA